jgi:RNA 3'-terminal phosphate cyclase (ATP)
MLDKGFLEINGSHLEGGGQIVRGAVSLSAMTGKKIKVHHIRARRDTPGLAAQHVAAIESVARICDAEVRGNCPGSSSVTFIPAEPVRKDIDVSVGTAGSCSLVIQCWLPVALSTGGRITVTGGTDVSKSPPADWLDRVLLETLRRAGANISMEITRRGFFPVGGGSISIEAGPGGMRPVTCDPGKVFREGGIISVSAGLPRHIAERQGASAQSVVMEKTGEHLPLTIREEDGGPGSICTVWRGCKGGSALGKKGLPAEKVGEMAAKGFYREWDSHGAADRYLADQLVIYLAQYGGSLTTGNITRHTETMLWLAGLFGSDIRVEAGTPQRIFNENSM